MRDSSTVVRHFVEEKIIEPKRRNRIDSFSNDSKDFLDNLMNYIDSQKSQKRVEGEDDDDFDVVDMDRQSALYALVSWYRLKTSVGLETFISYRIHIWLANS